MNKKWKQRKTSWLRVSPYTFMHIKHVTTSPDLTCGHWASQWEHTSSIGYAVSDSLSAMLLGESLFGQLRKLQCELD